MFDLSPMHIIVILLVVVLIFGTKKLRNVGSDLGAAVRGFKEGMRGEDKPADSAVPPAQKIDHDKPV